MNISFIGTKMKLLFLTVSGLGGKVLVDVGGCTGGRGGKRPRWVSGCWPRLTHQLTHRQGHLLVSQSEQIYPQASEKSE